MMAPIIALGAKAARYCIAVPMAIYGVQHFVYLRFVADFIPGWIPGRVFWAAFTGIALIAAAAGIVFKKWDRLAATLLGTMIFLWVVLLHTSRIAAQPNEQAEWRGFFQALAMSGCAFALVESLPRTGRPAAPRQNRFEAAVNVLSVLGARFAPRAIALSMVAFGAQHFVVANVAASQVPLWIPGSAFANYVSGMALIAAGVGLVFDKTARITAVMLGLGLVLSVIFVHAPAVLASSRFESDWCKALVMAAGAFLMAHEGPPAAVPRSAPSPCSLPRWESGCPKGG